MSFGVVLKDCLNEANASVRNFSQITGINRGWVYNIFNGKKPCLILIMKTYLVSTLLKKYSSLSSL